MTSTVLVDREDVAAETAPVLPHMVAPSDSDKFAFWRWSVLRGAGFPTQWVARLSAPASAAAADDLLVLEKGFRERLDELTERVRKELDGEQDRSRRNKLRKALDKLRRGVVPQEVEGA